MADISYIAFHKARINTVNPKCQDKNRPDVSSTVPHAEGDIKHLVAGKSVK